VGLPFKNGVQEQDKQEVREDTNQMRTILRRLLIPLAVLQVRRHLAEINATKGNVAVAVVDDMILNPLREFRSQQLHYPRTGKDC
jgi:hypothetical protein